jgi:hypothetical protein
MCWMLKGIMMMASLSAVVSYILPVGSHDATQAVAKPTSGPWSAHNTGACCMQQQRRGRGAQEWH